MKNSKTGTVTVVNHDYLNHSVSTKQRAEVSPKETGSQTEVAEIQRTISTANGTDGTQTKHRKPARRASSDRCEIANKGFQTNNTINYFSRVWRTRSGRESKQRFDPEYVYSIDAHCLVIKDSRSQFPLPLPPPPPSSELLAAYAAPPATPPPTSRAASSSFSIF